MTNEFLTAGKSKSSRRHRGLGRGRGGSGYHWWQDAPRPVDPETGGLLPLSSQKGFPVALPSGQPCFLLPTAVHPERAATYLSADAFYEAQQEECKSVSRNKNSVTASIEDLAETLKSQWKSKHEAIDADFPFVPTAAEQDRWLPPLGAFGSFDSAVGAARAQNRDSNLASVFGLVGPMVRPAALFSSISSSSSSCLHRSSYLLVLSGTFFPTGELVFFSRVPAPGRLCRAQLQSFQRKAHSVHIVSYGGA